MSHDRQHLLDILSAAKLARTYVRDKSRDDFLADTQCQDAVVRRLEIIGEAARRVSSEARASLPELPWHAMIGMRNLMIHEYDEVDLEVVWATVQNRLPALIGALEDSLGAADA
ncbi:MAG: HepT-like ribonuclease domain-containing protein [Anaerolineae bacterium]